MTNEHLSPTDQGREAYLTEGTLEDNPYHLGDAAYAEWQYGFNKAKADDPLADLFGQGDHSEDDDEPH